jgi:hypothetical protein
VVVEDSAVDAVVGAVVVPVVEVVGFWVVVVVDAARPTRMTTVEPVSTSCPA